MPQVLLWVTIFSLQTTIITAQNPSFEQLDTSLSSYFFDGNRNTAGWLRWKPQLGDKLNFPVSYDGLCYTRLDTVLYISLREQNYAVALFRTVAFMSENEKMLCRSCSPAISVATFREKGNSWYIQDFEAVLSYFGAWNERGEVRLMQISHSSFGMGIQQPPTGVQGYTEGREQIYYQGTDLLFSYIYERDIPDSYQLKQTIEFKSTVLSPLHDIELQRTRTYLQGQKKHSKRLFRYNAALRQYLELKE